MIETLGTLAFIVIRYTLFGAIAVGLGWFIGDQWQNRTIPRWSSWLAIIGMGFLVWHAPEVAAAIGSNSQFTD